MPHTKEQAIRQRHAASHPPSPFFPSSSLQEDPIEHAKKIDQEVDNKVVYEFGGPVGCSLMMVGFPVLMVYLWICVEFYGGILISFFIYVVLCFCSCIVF